METPRSGYGGTVTLLPCLSSPGGTSPNGMSLPCRTLVCHCYVTLGTTVCPLGFSPLLIPSGHSREGGRDPTPPTNPRISNVPCGFDGIFGHTIQCFESGRVRVTSRSRPETHPFPDEARHTILLVVSHLLVLFWVDLRPSVNSPPTS